MGYYVAVDATSEDVVRGHAMKYFGKMWCSVYTEPYRSKDFKCIVINENDPIVLNDSPDWE